MTTGEREVELFITHRFWREGSNAGKLGRGADRKNVGPGADTFIRVHGWSDSGFPSQVLIG